MKRCPYDDCKGCCHANGQQECPENVSCGCEYDINGKPLLSEESGIPFWD